MGRALVGVFGFRAKSLRHRVNWMPVGPASGRRTRGRPIGHDGQGNGPHIAALQQLEAALEEHRRAQAEEPAHEANAAAKSERRKSERRELWKPGWRLPFNPWSMFDRRHPVVRRVTFVSIGIVGVLVIGCSALWWRLSSGPIMLDLATPWLTSAIEAEFRQSLSASRLAARSSSATPRATPRFRLRDIVVRDTSGVTVAMAPKAEVGIAGTSLLMARPRAESLRLVDANMLIRIDPEGRIDVFAGGERPFASVSPGGAAPQAPATSSFSLQALAERSPATNMVALLAWIDSLGSETANARRLRWPGADRGRHHQRQSHHRRSPDRTGVEPQSTLPCG